MKATRITVWRPKPLTPEQQERKRRQAQTRRDQNRADKKARANIAALNESVASIDAVESTAPQESVAPKIEVSNESAAQTSLPIDPDREAYWQSCEKARKRRDLSQLADDLERGVEGVDDAELAKAAVALAQAVRDAGVTGWSWPPCPTQDELADRDDWLAERLAAAKDEQEAAKKQRQSLTRLRKAGLSSQPAGGSNPIDQQNLSCSLDEFADKLAWTVKTHQTARGAFKRALLDHKSDYYIGKDEGGVSNKMIRLAANQIAGRKQREFDESWNIVCAWMRERGIEIKVA